MAYDHEQSIDSCVQGSHVYIEKWSPKIGHNHLCKREQRNVLDRYTVAIVKADGTVVGHLSKEISLVTSLVSLYTRQD